MKDSLWWIKKGSHIGSSPQGSQGGGSNKSSQTMADIVAKDEMIDYICKHVSLPL